MTYIYIMTCSKYLFYLLIFTDVQSGLLISCDRFQICKQFCPKSYDYIRIYGRNRFCYSCPQFFQTCKKRCNKTLSLTYPDTEES
jgi:putative component of membrane protein insertase Oxa1/YidC/SpoIIIJ protein YidD